MLALITSLLGSAIKPIATVFTKGIERKAAKEQLKIKAAMSKQELDAKIELTDAEWEVIKSASEGSTWKDEYVTLIITWPFVGIMLGTVVGTFTGDLRMLTATVEGIKALGELGIDMGELMLVVVLAAVSLKAWRGK